MLLIYILINIYIYIYIFKIDKKEYPKIVDFVITLGGDGTILHTSSLFPKEVPPIISFSLGTLGFLLPYSTCLIIL